MSASAVAQGATQATADKSASADTIVVTGERRSESLQNVPAAVAAVNSQKLQEAGVQNFEDLQNLTPSLSIVDGTGGRYINIRGEGIGVGTPFQNAGVPLMIDNLFIPRGENFLRDAYFDLQSVEIYRGPQGTYAGQNSTGGAIFVTAKQPSFDNFDAYVEQTFGDYNWYKTQAAVNLPISDKWAARIAVNAETRDSFFNNDPGTVGPSPVPGVNVYNGIGKQTGYKKYSTQPGNLGRESLRVILRFQPVDTLDIRARFDYIHEANDGDVGLRSEPFVKNDPSHIPNVHDIHYDFPQWGRTDVQRGTVNVEWSGLDWFTVRSVSGYQHYVIDAGTDTDNFSPFQTNLLFPAPAGATTIGQAFATTLTSDHYFFQEIDLISKGKGPFKWVLGADALDQNTPIHNDNGSYGYTGNTAAGTCSAGATQCAISYFNIGVGTFGPSTILDYYQAHQSQAVFGDVTYNVLPQVELSLGARYTWDRIILKRGSSVQSWIAPSANPLSGNWYVTNSAAYVAAGGGIVPVFCGGAAGNAAPQDGCHVYGAGQFADATGRFAIDWHINDNVSAYALFSQGFKPGGYQTQLTLNGIGPQPPYKEETIRNYEGWPEIQALRRRGASQPHWIL